MEVLTPALEERKEKKKGWGKKIMGKMHGKKSQSQNGAAGSAAEKEAEPRGPESSAGSSPRSKHEDVPDALEDALGALTDERDVLKACLSQSALELSALQERLRSLEPPAAGEAASAEPAPAEPEEVSASVTGIYAPQDCPA